MKLSEFKKRVEETIIGILNEVEEDPVKTATDAVKNAELNLKTATQSANINKTSKAKQMIAKAAEEKVKAAKAEKVAAEEEKKERGNQPPPKKPGV